jgi:hypothetical protein
MASIPNVSRSSFLREVAVNLERLKALFEPKDVQWRIGRGGVKNDKPWAMWLAYIDARACQERLDEVFGPLGWQTRYDIVPYDGNKFGVLCHIGVKSEGGEWVWKCNGAPLTDIESFKGGISDAFRRVCAGELGIGRYLYDFTETFTSGSITEVAGWRRETITTKPDNRRTTCWFPEPKLPDWAMPEGKKHIAPEPPPPPLKVAESSDKLTDKNLERMMGLLTEVELTEEQFCNWYYNKTGRKLAGMADLPNDKAALIGKYIKTKTEEIRTFGSISFG